MHDLRGVEHRLSRLQIWRVLSDRNLGFLGWYSEPGLGRIIIPSMVVLSRLGPDVGGVLLSPADALPGIDSHCGVGSLLHSNIALPTAL
jgi:hypothetical protein